MFKLMLEGGRVLEGSVEGLLRLDEADRYVVQLREHVETMRRNRGYSLAIIDGRESAIQPQNVMEKLATLQSILIANDRDRAAYIVTSSLAKLQAQRLSTTRQLKVFLSPSAARTWLLAHHLDDATQSPSELSDPRQSH